MTKTNEKLTLVNANVKYQNNNIQPVNLKCLVHLLYKNGTMHKQMHTKMTQDHCVYFSTNSSLIDIFIRIFWQSFKEFLYFVEDDPVCTLTVFR